MKNTTKQTKIRTANPGKHTVYQPLEGCWNAWLSQRMKSFKRNCSNCLSGVSREAEKKSPICSPMLLTVQAAEDGLSRGHAPDPEKSNTEINTNTGIVTHS